MTQKQPGKKSKELLTKQLPCEDCITFSICNGIVSPILDITQQKGIIFKLYDRCSLMRDYISKSEAKKVIDVFGLEHEELDINSNRLKIAHTYFEEFKRRDQ